LGGRLASNPPSRVLAAQYLVKATGSTESENNYLDFESFKRALFNLVSCHPLAH
jgi:hypothetical protein